MPKLRNELSSMAYISRLHNKMTIIILIVTNHKLRLQIYIFMASLNLSFFRQDALVSSIAKTVLHNSQSCQLQHLSSIVVQSSGVPCTKNIL